MSELPNIATLKLTALELGMIMGLFLDWRQSNRLPPGGPQPFDGLLHKLNKEAAKIYARPAKSKKVPAKNVNSKRRSPRVLQAN